MNRNYKIPESVLVVIHTVELEVLLMERTDRPGYWQSVTGSKQTYDEMLQETAIREVWEETGIIVSATPQSGTLAVKTMDAKSKVPLTNLQDWQLTNVFDIYPLWRHRYAPGILQNTEHVFGLRVPRDISVSLEPREHLGYIWLPYLKAAEKCFSPSNAEAILRLPNCKG
jgi:dATP pyrophosphohydrolase